MDWKVLHDKVLVKRDEALTEKGGLAVAEKFQRKQSQGTVIGVGSTVTTVTRGDRVKFTAFSGIPLDEDDESVVILREAELLAYQRPSLKAAVS